jgi:hypothetical protein
MNHAAKMIMQTYYQRNKRSYKNGIGSFVTNPILFKQA